MGHVNCSLSIFKSLLYRSLYPTFHILCSESWSGENTPRTHIHSENNSNRTGDILASFVFNTAPILHKSVHVICFPHQSVIDRSLPKELNSSLVRMFGLSTGRP